jgi:hypothetical protein
MYAQFAAELAAAHQGAKDLQAAEHARSLAAAAAAKAAVKADNKTRAMTASGSDLIPAIRPPPPLRLRQLLR